MDLIEQPGNGLDTKVEAAVLNAVSGNGEDGDRWSKRLNDYRARSGTTLVGAAFALAPEAEDAICAALSKAVDVERCNDEDFAAVALDAYRIPLRFLETSRACPISEGDEVMVVATSDPTDPFVAEALGMAFGKRIETRLATPSHIERLLDSLYGDGSESMSEIVDGVETAGEDDNLAHLIDLASETPIVRLVNTIISRAVNLHASDIHVEPFDNRLKIRYRIDGVLQDMDAPPSRSAAAVISRFKIMAQLDIAERRLPQDGRIQRRVLGKIVDLRVSTVPTLHGESVVLRILDKTRLPLDFQALGFSGDAAPAFIRSLEQPNGIILVTGPTGSGKTTTLYAALQRLNSPERKILTVEDPIEYQLEGINQIQVQPQIDLSFANALRSIVRQDPDVIMIGEMRDLETASIAVQSALTGHLVLSTLHTNSAASAITRLLDMRVEDYLLTSTINSVLAQRLVRTLCEACARPFEPEPGLLADLRLNELGVSPVRSMKRPQGCNQCGATGYTGRTVIHEHLPMTETIRRLILDHTDASGIEKSARAAGMRTMHEDGMLKALQGVTTVEEVARVTDIEN